MLHRLKNAWIDLIVSRYTAERDLSRLTLYDLCKVVDDDFILRQKHLPQGWQEDVDQKHLRTKTLDAELTVELTDIFRGVTLAELFAPDKDTKTSRRAVKKRPGTADKISL